MGGERPLRRLLSLRTDSFDEHQRSTVSINGPVHGERSLLRAPSSRAGEIESKGRACAWSVGGACAEKERTEWLGRVSEGIGVEIVRSQRRFERIILRLTPQAIIRLCSTRPGVLLDGFIQFGQTGIQRQFGLVLPVVVVFLVLGGIEGVLHGGRKQSWSEWKFVWR